MIFKILLSFLAIFISAKALATESFEIKNVNIIKEGPYWVSEWAEFELPAGVASFQINSFSSPEVFVQVTDLIAPHGAVYVQSDSSGKLGQYSQPVLKNVVSANRSEAVIKGMSTLLVPNNPLLRNPPAGVWKFRTLSHYQPLMKIVNFEVVVKLQNELVKNNIDIRVKISPDSYWTKTSGQVEKVIAAAQASLAEAGLNLRVLSVDLLASPAQEPMDLPTDMVAIAGRENSKDAINVYLMPSMLYQNKPINGLACLGAAVDLQNAHSCFVSMYADLRGDQITLQNQGKILAHEIGHYLGLFHTKDDGYYAIGTVYDKLEDTPEIVTGSNMMDPGIHNETPHFSPMQMQMLRLSPVLK